MDSFAIPGWDSHLNYQLIGEPIMFKKQVKCINCGFLAYYEFPEMSLKAGANLSFWQQLKDLGYLDPKECTQRLRDNWIENPEGGFPTVICARHVWGDLDVKAIGSKGAHSFVFAERQCPFFFQYNSGYSPIEHRELQRDNDQRRFLIVVSLMSAAVGAGIATLANLVWSLLTK